jgi:Ni/Co efflux regulator RcnB
MNQRFKRVLAMLIAASLASGPVLADPPPGKGYNKHQDDDHKGDRHDDRYDKHGGPQRDDHYDDRLYRQYPDPHRPGATIELRRAGVTVYEARDWAHRSEVDFRGYKPLPPGIRKNLARGKPLPPGIAMKAPPPRYIERLPRYEGYEWRVYGTDLVLVAIGTAIVADILNGVFQ